MIQTSEVRQGSISIDKSSHIQAIGHFPEDLRLPEFTIRRTACLRELVDLNKQGENPLQRPIESPIHAHQGPSMKQISCRAQALPPRFAYLSGGYGSCHHNCSLDPMHGAVKTASPSVVRQVLVWRDTNWTKRSAVGVACHS